MKNDEIRRKVCAQRTHLRYSNSAGMMKTLNKQHEELANAIINIRMKTITLLERIFIVLYYLFFVYVLWAARC